MQLDIPLPSIVQLCVDRQEQTARIGAQTGIIDCCAGIGAFSMGIVDSTKASIPLAIENDAEIAEQYGKLHPKTVVVDKGVALAAKNWDVLKIRTKMDQYKHVILQAGVPCQPFSRLNR
jgi:site-specific DNA-cytosine methylase